MPLAAHGPAHGSGHPLWLPRCAGCGGGSGVCSCVAASSHAPHQRRTIGRPPLLPLTQHPGLRICCGYLRIFTDIRPPEPCCTASSSPSFPHRNYRQQWTGCVINSTPASVPSADGISCRTSRSSLPICRRRASMPSLQFQIAGGHGRRLLAEFARSSALVRSSTRPMSEIPADWVRSIWFCLPDLNLIRKSGRATGSRSMRQ